MHYGYDDKGDEPTNDADSEADSRENMDNRRFEEAYLRYSLLRMRERHGIKNHRLPLELDESIMSEYETFTIERLATTLCHI